jgi:hypothetical protein
LPSEKNGGGVRENGETHPCSQIYWKKEAKMRSSGSWFSDFGIIIIVKTS